MPLNKSFIERESKEGGGEMKTTKGWTVVIVGIVTSLMFGISAALAAADYPTRAIDVVIPFGPGGGTDLTVRLFKDHVEKLLGQPMVIVYKPGAAGVIAGAYVKESKPDGYTLFISSNTSLVSAILARKADFTLDDFVPICTLTLSPTIFSVNKDSPYKTFKDFTEAAKTKKMKYGTTSTFSTGHVLIEAIGRKEGFEALQVPIGGGAKAATAVLGGHLDASFVSPVGIESQLRILAVNKADRWEAYPDVPTLKELGYPNVLETYFSVFAPKGTPKEIIDKIHGAYVKAFEANKEEITKVSKNTHQIARILGPAELEKIDRESYVFFQDMLSKIKAPDKAK
jgi:tripartite-type tricarboxylate transporter receptor subunit TctC